MKLFLTTLMVCISTISYALPVTDENLNTAPLSLAIESSLLELEVGSQDTLPQEEPPQEIDNTATPEEALIQKSFSDQNITGYACNISHTPSESTKWSILLYNFDDADDSGTVVFSTNKNRKIQSVACTPDGEKVVFSFQESTQGDSEIYSLNTATKDVVKLTDNDTDDVDVSMSKDGLVMAWQKRLTDDRQAITIRTYDKNSTSFTEKSLASAYPFVQPSLSANGDWLALVQMRTNNFLALRYDVMNSTFQTIHSIPRRKRLYHPSLSADGNIYGWVENKNQSRYVVKNILKNTETRLITGIEGIEHPFISQDGKRVVYSLGEQALIKNIDSGVTEEIASSSRYLGNYWVGDFNITGIDQIGSWGTSDSLKILDIVVQGDYAYTLQDYKFVILDISNPSLTENVSEIDFSSSQNFATKIKISGNQAFLFGKDKFYIIDISDPKSPVILEENNFEVIALSVSGDGEIIFVTDRRHLYIKESSATGQGGYIGDGIDLSSYHNYIRGVDISGDYVYVTGNSSLSIVNIADPNNIEVASNYSISGVCSTKVSSGYAYLVCSGVTESEIFRVIDVRDPKKPTLVRTNDFSKLSYVFGEISILNNNAFIRKYSGSDDKGMYILDISNPGAVKVVGDYNSSSLGPISIKENLIYAAGPSQGLFILDYSELETISFVSTYELTSKATGITTKGKYAYITDATYGLIILDISNPVTPIFVGLYSGLVDSGLLADNIAVNGNYIYAASNGYLQIINVENPKAPTARSYYFSNLLWAGDVDYSDGYVYVETSGKFVMIDVADPFSPKEVKYLSYHRGEGFVLSDDKLYLSHYRIASGSQFSGFRVYDKQSLEYLGAYEVEESNYGGELSISGLVSNEKVYGIMGDKLSVYDVSDDANPIKITEFDQLDTSNSMVIDGDFAYVADRYGLLVLDLSNPITPSITTSIDFGLDNVSNYRFRHVVVHRGYIYMVDNEKGLRVLKAH